MVSAGGLLLLRYFYHCHFFLNVSCPEKIPLRGLFIGMARRPKHFRLWHFNFSPSGLMAYVLIMSLLLRGEGIKTTAAGGGRREQRGDGRHRELHQQETQVDKPKR